MAWPSLLTNFRRLLPTVVGGVLILAPIGCSESGQDDQALLPTQEDRLESWDRTETSVIPFPEPEWYGAGTTSILERVYNADTIVRAKLIDISDVEDPSLVGFGLFSFNAIEYLQGTGPDTFVVMDFPDHIRGKSWIDREAVLFLNGPEEVDADAASSAGSVSLPFTFLRTHPLESGIGYVTIGDSNNAAWLPSNSSDIGSSLRSDLPAQGNPSYITDSNVPLGDSEPTVSLTELRSTISWVGGGENVPRYDDCIRSVIHHYTWHNDYETHYGKVYDSPHYDVELRSGMSENVSIESLGARGALYERVWVEGADAKQFRAQIIDADDNPANGYIADASAVRPLPSGIYEVTTRSQYWEFIPCNFIPSKSGIAEYSVTVTAPAGTVHEAFFDPVALAGRVGADTSGNAGVLSPRHMTVKGKSAYLESLSWQSGEVTLGLMSGTDLSGLALDVIDIDGQTSQSLTTNDAAVDSAKKTYTWPVADAPWAAGDLLMICLRDASTTVTPVTPTATPGGPTSTSVPPRTQSKTSP